MTKKKGWYAYYGLKTEPNLQIDPLTSVSDLELFVGRAEHIETLREWIEEKGITRAIVTGPAGVGKTSLICKSLGNRKEFIRLNLSLLPDFNLIYSFIARSLLNRTIIIKCHGAKKLKNDYEKVIQITKGRQLKVGLVGSVKSNFSETSIPIIAADHVHNIIEKAINLLHRKLGSIILLLDEGDLLREATRENILSVIRSLQLKNPSLLLWAVRDIRIRELWENPNSVERQLFLWHLDIPPLGNSDSPTASDVLYKRLIELSSKKASKIICKELADQIAILANGNIREYIRFSKEILKDGSKNKVSLPIQTDFAISTILKYHKELSLAKDERDVLKWLKRKPSSSSESRLKKILDLKETQVRERLKALEQQNLAVVERKKYGKLIYRPSKKALILLEFSK